MVYYFTADTHYLHQKILKYNDRSYNSIEEMNEDLIKKYNEIVTGQDFVFFLGDFSFGKKQETKDIIGRLNGNITFIRGNHDNKSNINSIIEYALINHGGLNIWLCHNPADSNPVYPLNLVGHVHKNWKVKYCEKNCCVLYNVGVDVNDNKPITILEILNNIRESKLVPDKWFRKVYKQQGIKEVKVVKNG